MEREGWDLLEQMARKGRFQAEALRLVAAYAYGKPSQQLQVTEEIKQKGIVLTIGGTEEEYIEGLRAARRAAE